MKFIARGAGEWQQGRGYRKRPILSAADLNCEGTLVQMVEIPAGSCVGEHHHKQMTEVFHIIAGHGTMHINGQRFDLGPGDTLTTEPNDRHDAANTSAEVFRYVVFKTNVVPGDSYWEDDSPGTVQSRPD